jgi:hypothetical protein
MDADSSALVSGERTRTVFATRLRVNFLGLTGPSRGLQAFSGIVPLRFAVTMRSGRPIYN